MGTNATAVTYTVADLSDKDREVTNIWYNGYNNAEFKTVENGDVYVITATVNGVSANVTVMVQD